MLQDCAWSPVVKCITKAILGDIGWLVASCIVVHALENAIDARRVDLAKAILQPWVIAYGAGTHEASPKKFQRKRRVETYHFTGVVVYTVKIPGTRGIFY